MFRRGRSGLITALAIAIFGSGGALAADDLTIAVGNQGNWENSISELGQKAGIFARHGLNLNVLYTQGGGETQQAVISGSVDIGVGVGPYGAIGAFAKGAPIRVIGSTLTGPNDQYWYVPADSPIQKPADMAGRTVAYSTNGSSTQIVVLTFQDHFGIEFQPVATGNATATYTQAMSGQVDVGWASPPFGLQDLAEGKIRIVARASDISAFRDQTVRILVANPSVLESKKDAIARYFAGYRETIEWMYSNPEAMKQYAALASIPEATAIRIRDELRPKADIDPARIAGMDNIVADAIKLGYLPQKLSAEQLATLVQIPDLAKK